MCCMDQEVALGVLLSGRNAFITGAAGAGKTFLLNEFMLRAKQAGKRVAKTASTGIAATLLSGNTIHSWSGIGMLDHLTHKFFTDMPKSRRETILRTDILVIDEISMLKDWYLDLVDEVCKIVRVSSKPFGGLQVIFCGDFTQLPPINRDDNKNGKYAYLAKSWQEAEPVICHLTTQFRQEDSEFVDILNALRRADYRRHHVEKLLSRKGADLPGNHTELHTTNRNVDEVNERHLADLLAEGRSYRAEFSGREGYVEGLKKSVLAPEVLNLKIGATVMALKNDPDKRFVNGSIGEVVEFEKTLGYPIVRFNNGRTTIVSPDIWERRENNHKLAAMTQIPLKLAWAITVHKSQGMTLDAAVVNLSYAFSPGMGYVALSRVKSLEALSLVGLSKSALMVEPRAVEMNKIWEEESIKLAETFKDLRTSIVKRAPKKLPKKQIEDDEEEPSEKSEKSKAWAEKLSKMREVYPKAFCGWTEDEDLELQEMLLDGDSVGEMVEKTGRQPGAVRARLKKNYGEELFKDGFPN